jgi:hypothetical protein
MTQRTLLYLHLAVQVCASSSCVTLWSICNPLITPCPFGYQHNIHKQIHPLTAKSPYSPSTYYYLIFSPIFLELLKQTSFCVTSIKAFPDWHEIFAAVPTTISPKFRVDCGKEIRVVIHTNASVVRSVCDNVLLIR